LFQGVNLSAVLNQRQQFYCHVPALSAGLLVVARKPKSPMVAPLAAAPVVAEIGLLVVCSQAEVANGGVAGRRSRRG
jgi:hypothetical protein